MKKFTDNYGDEVEVYRTALGNVGIEGLGDLVFTPTEARRLAKAIKKAAKKVEASQ